MLFVFASSIPKKSLLCEPPCSLCLCVPLSPYPLSTPSLLNPRPLVHPHNIRFPSLLLDRCRYTLRIFRRIYEHASSSPRPVYLSSVCPRLQCRVHHSLDLGRGDPLNITKHRVMVGQQLPQPPVIQRMLRKK